MAVPIAMADGVRMDRDLAVVGIRDYAFEPAALRIAVGAWVRWVNLDDVPYGVVHAAHPHLFRSGVLFPGDSYTRQFSVAGEFPYRCAIHMHMRGRLSVG